MAKKTINKKKELSLQKNGNKTASVDVEVEIRDHINEATKLYRKGYTAEAEKVFKKAVSLSKNKSIIYNSMGYSLLIQAEKDNDVNLFDEAGKKFEKAIEIDSYISEAYWRWGATLLGKAKLISYNEKLFEEIIEKYEKAQSLDPEEYEDYLEFGKGLLELAKIHNHDNIFKKAINTIEKAIIIRNETKIGSDSEEEAEMYNELGLSLLEYAKVTQSEASFRQASEWFEVASRFNAWNHEIYFNWGLCLSDMAEIRGDENLYYESFEKFNNVNIINHNDPEANFFCGYNLLQIAKIKNEKIFYLKAIEKFKNIADSSNNYYDALYNWGIALVKLGDLTKKDNYYDEAILKFEEIANKVDQKDNKVRVICELGTFVSLIAKRKKDKILYEKSKKIFENAIKIDENNAEIHYNWANTCCDLAEISEPKYRQQLLEMAIEKYKIASEHEVFNFDIYLKWGIAIYRLLKLNNNKNLYKDATKCFKRSRKSLVEIYKNIGEEIHNDVLFNILSPLLGDYNTNDGRCFIDAIKKIRNNKDLANYKKAYLISISILSKLYVNNKYENLLAHYQKKSVTHKILFENSKFQLNSINYSNDPSEGKTLLYYIFDKKYEIASYERTYGAFASCFTFNHDSLNQFRLYGNENGVLGSGLSLVFMNNFFESKIRLAIDKDFSKRIFDGNSKNEKESRLEDDVERYSLFRCLYVNPITKTVETIGHKESYLFNIHGNKNEVKEYKKYITDILKSVKKQMIELKNVISKNKLDPEIISELLINLRYLTKNISYKEENECRIIKILPFTDKKIINDKEFSRMYIEYGPKVSLHIKEIYFGPNAENIEMFQDLLKKNDINIKCQRSKHPFNSY